VLCQVTDRQGRAHLSAVLDDAFDPRTAAWDLQPDGTWERSGEATHDFQELQMKRLADRGE
jgi:polyphosphate kinase